MSGETSHQRATPRPRRAGAALLATLLLAVAGVGFAQPASAAPAYFCDFGYFIGVRGSSEPAGAGTALDGNVYGSNGYGSTQLMKVAIDHDSMPFGTASLVYPADAGNYLASASIGRNNLVNHLNWVAQRCAPYRPAVVLAGFSQGAHVVENALLTIQGQPNLSREAKEMIRAVTLFGNPAYTPGQPYDAPGSGPYAGVFGARTASMTGEIASYRTWGWPPGASSQGWIYRVRSLCYPGDYFCQGNLSDSNYAIHNSYDDNGAMYDAWQWARAVLTVY